MNAALKINHIQSKEKISRIRRENNAFIRAPLHDVYQNLRYTMANI